MSAVLHFVLLQWGLTWAVTSASLLAPLRVAVLRRTPLGLGLYCAGCVGFWVGLLLRAVRMYPWPGAPLYGLEAGFVGTAVSLLLHLFAMPGQSLETEAELAGVTLSKDVAVEQ